MTVPMSNVAYTRIVLAATGKMCRRIIDLELSPDNLADSIKCSFFRRRASERANRAYAGHHITTRAIVAFTMFGPRIADIATAKTIEGTAKKMSVIRIRRSSMIPPEYPAVAPTTLPNEH